MEHFLLTVHIHFLVHPVENLDYFVGTFPLKLEFFVICRQKYVDVLPDFEGHCFLSSYRRGVCSLSWPSIRLPREI